MKSGYDPTRRNRNLGTRKQGHGRNNTMAIPVLCHDERIWWANLGPHSLVQRKLGSREVVFVVEEPRADCAHACTVDDICHMFSIIPKRDWEFLDTIVLGQSTRKQWILGPAWGRLAYSAEFGRPGNKPRRSGPAVLLEAVDPVATWEWSRNLSPTDSVEVERLKADGHSLEDTGKRLVFRSTLQAIRVTQLYRSLLHEIGHWVDWLEKVVRPANLNSDLRDALEDRYFASSKQEREVFAHRYADSLRKSLVAAGHIPFPPVVRPHSEARGQIMSECNPDRSAI
jgi:hypothetical protein